MHNPLLAPSARILQADNAKPLTEFALICLLKEQCDFIPREFSGDTLSLFRTHFLLFNALYQLQDEWQKSKQGHLVIDVLRIEFLSYDGVDLSRIRALMALQSPSLKAYYLDMQQLADTDQQAVEALLGQFWNQFDASDNRTAALATLGLAEPITMKEIKLAYRRKAMALHPDRGGNVADLQNVNNAMDQLKRYYR